MNNFFDYFNEDIGQVFQALWEAVVAFFNFLNYLFNFPMRMDKIKAHSPSFSTADWVMLLVVNIALVAACCALVYMGYKLIRKIFFGGISRKEYEKMAAQVNSLQKDLIRSNYEKDKILAMKMGDPQVPEEEEKQEEEEGEVKELAPVHRNTFDSPCVDPSESRFFRLTTVDNYYKTQYQAPTYNQKITLAELCDRFRAYNASQLHLYYEIDLIRHFIAALGTTRIVILQGISGTGKTSLPYAFGKFVQKDTTVVSVQPSWRERTELYGYFNEFTKRYSETEFLRAIYEGNYYRDPHMVILDEMNIARVEYYFAEMLSILELPRQEEQKVDVVSAVWENDPCLIEGGAVQIPNNIWFVGTINNDDSTFAVADKVYDRAIPIDLDSRAEAFECDEASPIYLSTDRLIELFDEAKQTYPVSQEMLDKLEELNNYLIRTFRLAFGNRIMKQIGDYVPCYIACGGTELQGIDFIVAKKVLRKFESLNLGFMREELTKFSAYLDKLFGKNSMPVCKDYIEQLKKNM